ncbi:MAG: 50S ribosomal protein L9 [Bacteroidia bacterium]|nr:50S ribosomal protein L9 [Bacteroidia bacterium]NNC85461.1 50S ribosomal protein L9 [Bacteroidia bacterium]NNM16770.1 50S ribosomal protein L9 [Bacteroidia bacterium]
MEVILKQDVDHLGYTDDLVKVKPGYARNFLFPNGMAVVANEVNRKIHAETVKQRAFKAGQIVAEAQKVASSLEDVILSVPAKVGEKGKLFGSVTTQNIADILNKMGYKVDKKQISLPTESVKTLGAYVASLQLHREVKVPVNFEVVEEG